MDQKFLHKFVESMAAQLHTVIKEKGRYQKLRNCEILVNISNILLFSQIVVNNIICNKIVALNFTRMQNRNIFTIGFGPHSTFH